MYVGLSSSGAIIAVAKIIWWSIGTASELATSDRTFAAAAKKLRWPNSQSAGRSGLLPTPRLLTQKALTGAAWFSL